MGGGDEIDIMAADFLEVNHHIGKIFQGNFMAFAQMTYLIILTEETTQVAVSHEYRARTTSAHQGLFFSKVGMVARDDGQFSYPADPLFASQSVNQAFPGAKAAFFEELMSFFDSFREFSALVKFDVAWLKRVDM